MSPLGQKGTVSFPFSRKISLKKRNLSNNSGFKMGSGAAAQLADGPNSDPLRKKEGGKGVNP